MTHQLLRPRTRPVTFEFDRQFFNVFAGPIDCAPADTFRVRLAPEVNAPCEITVAVPDFGIPANPAEFRAAALTLIRTGLREKVRPYTGCKGGIGRTGIMLATIAKILGEEHPVRWVRIHYRREAVETRGQEAFVASLDVSAEQDWLRRRARLRRLTWGLFGW